MANNTCCGMATYILQRAMTALVPLTALEDLCESQEEFNKYAELREDMIIEIGALTGYYMMKHHPQDFSVDVGTREAYKNLEHIRDDLARSLDINATAMNELVKDEKRFNRFRDLQEAFKNQA